MKLYLSGQMTGLPDHGEALFNSTAKSLRGAGFTVLNPSENFGDRKDLPRAEYMRVDIESVLKSDAVAVLENWRVSKGAQLEVAIARELGLPIYDAAKLVRQFPGAPENAFVKALRDEFMGMLTDGHFSLAPDPESALLEAHRLVHGDRGHNYGHPIDDFTRTAGMLTALFRDKLKDEAQITAADVPQIVICIKLSREQNKPKRDNRVDIAGYAETLEMVHERQGD